MIEDVQVVARSRYERAVGGKINAWWDYNWLTTVIAVTAICTLLLMLKDERDNRPVIRDCPVMGVEQFNWVPAPLRKS